MHKKIGLWLCVFVLVAASPLLAAGNTNQFVGGFQKILLAPFQIPLQTAGGALSGSPIVGTVGGLIGGTLKTITDLVGGTFDMVAAAAPLAKYAIFFL